jgi:hypothetical protein
VLDVSLLHEVFQISNGEAMPACAFGKADRLEEGLLLSELINWIFQICIC